MNKLITCILFIFLLSCASTSDTIVDPIDLKESLYTRLEESLEKGEVNTALHTAGRLFSKKLIDEDEYKYLIGRITNESTENNDEILMGLQSSIDSPEEKRFPVEKSNELIDIQHAVQSTVTIKINKGTRIENGLGIPDIVIGSGFFISPDGHILTNYHVISSEVDPEYEGRSDLYVYLNEDDKNKIPANVIGFNKEFDVALIKIPVESPAFIPYNPAFELAVGDKIWAVGSPGGLSNSVSAGILSSMARDFLSLGSVYQIDVPINPGNSGGPLFTEDGRLAGVIFAGIEQFEGVNFAIPIKYVDKMLGDLFIEGKIDFAWLGISFLETRKGLEVIYVAPESPADAIDIRTGDILLDINDQSFTKLESILWWILGKNSGDPVKVRLNREGDELSLFAYLDTRPAEPILEGLKNYTIEKMFPALLGMELTVISRNFFNDEYLVSNIYPGSYADESGFSIDDYIVIEKARFLDKHNYVQIQLFTKQKKEGFLEKIIVLTIPITTEDHI